MPDRRDEFIKERKYLLNVSEATVSWYRHALYKWLPGDSPSEPELKSMVIRMREARLKATGCNAAIRAINCYLKWSGSPVKVPKLKEPQMVIQFMTGKISGRGEDHILKLVLIAERLQFFQISTHQRTVGFNDKYLRILFHPPVVIEP